jgi:hypothetical protein
VNGYVRFKTPHDVGAFLAGLPVVQLRDQGHIKTVRDDRLLIFSGVAPDELQHIQSAATQLDAEVILSQQYEALGQ